MKKAFRGQILRGTLGLGLKKEKKKRGKKNKKERGIHLRGSPLSGGKPKAYGTFLGRLGGKSIRSSSLKSSAWTQEKGLKDEGVQVDQGKEEERNISDVADPRKKTPWKRGKFPNPARLRMVQKGREKVEKGKAIPRKHYSRKEEEKVAVLKENPT